MQSGTHIMNIQGTKIYVHNLEQWWATCGPRATFMRPSDLYIIEQNLTVWAKVKGSVKIQIDDRHAQFVKENRDYLKAVLDVHEINVFS